MVAGCQRASQPIQDAAFGSVNGLWGKVLELLINDELCKLLGETGFIPSFDVHAHVMVLLCNDVGFSNDVCPAFGLGFQHLGRFFSTKRRGLHIVVLEHLQHIA